MNYAKTFLWTTLAGVIFLAVAKQAVPALDGYPPLWRIQLFLLGSFISTAVWMTIVSYGEDSTEGRQEPSGKEPLLIPPHQVYASQKTVALLMSLLLLVILLAAIYMGGFEKMGGWLLAPITGIGPALYLRDFHRN